MKRIELPRRLFLRGVAGVTVALPFLETFAPRPASGAAAPGFRYALFVRQGNGVAQKSGSEPDRFWPSKVGPLTKESLAADLAADRTLGVLSELAGDLLVVRGLKYNFSTSGCGHSDGGIQCLTAAKPNGPNKNQALPMGESIDNRIVRELSPAGSEPLCLYAGPKDGYLDDVLSYRGPGDRRAGEQNPFNAYKRVFGVPGTTTDQQAQLASQRKSVNDLVRAQMKALMGRSELSKGDHERLELHFDSIRDIEVKMGCHLDPARYGEIAAIDPKKVGAGDQIEKIAMMHMDIMALAVSCGLVHASTLQIGNGNDQTQYVIDGVKQERYHHISHRINGDGSSGDPIPDAAVKHHKIDMKFAGLFQYLVNKLKAYPTPAGTLLDEGVAIWFNDLADGPPHGSSNVPWVCAGKAGGYLKTGQYVDAGNGKLVTNNKILNTIGAAVGVKNASGGPLDDFGDPSLEKGLIAQMIA